MPITNDDYNETVTQIMDASGTVDLDLSTANVFYLEAIDDITFTISNTTTDPEGNSMVVYVVDIDGAGPYTLTWPSDILWSQDNPVGQVDQNSNVEISFISYNGGIYFGRKSGEAFTV